MMGIITFKKRLTVKELREHSENLKNAIKQWKETIIDAGSVEKVDLAGLQMFISLKKECERLGHRVYIRSSRTIDELMNSMGLKF